MGKTASSTSPVASREVVMVLWQGVSAGLAAQGAVSQMEEQGTAWNSLSK